MHRTCGEPNEIKKNTHPANIPALFCGQVTVNPQDLAFATESPAISAIVHAYYPQHYAGEAIADVLLGVVSPAGRMPYTWPKDLSLAGNISNCEWTHA